MLYVAVVVRKGGVASGRPKGDWSCFTGNVKAEVIERALEAKRDWQRNGHGPYDVLVGRVAEAVRVPQNWELVSIPKIYEEIPLRTALRRGDDLIRTRRDAGNAPNWEDDEL